MPIIPLHPARRISQPEFQELSYAVMGHVFQIHNEFGRYPDERHAFEIESDRWNRSLTRAEFVRDSLTSVVRDWGTGLELGLYEAALTHFLGGDEIVMRNVAVHGDGHSLGNQPMRLVADGIAFTLTAFESEAERFEDHARRLLRHVDLRALVWVNIGLKRVAFTTIEGVGL